MGRFSNFIKSIGENIGDRIRAKSYIGLLPGSLPRSDRKWGNWDFLNANEISLYVNKAISKRAEKVGDIEFELKDSNGNIIENDPLLDLLYKPNKIFTGTEFWALYQKYYDLIGEAYIFIERGGTMQDGSKVTGLHLPRPDLMEKKFEGGNIVKYIYKTPQSEYEYDPEDIIYIHRPDPKSPVNGISLLKAGVNAMQTETQIAEHQSRIIDNGGKVEGVFKFKTDVLTEDQLKDVKRQYKQEYAGAKKAGIPMFLGGDADYIKMGLTPKELDYLEAKKSTLDDICILTEVPKSILASFTDVKFDNADAARETFLGDTIRPLLKKLTTSLDERFFPDDRDLGFVDPTPERLKDELKKVESGIKNYYMTINEAREMQGLDPVSDGDKLLVPFNVTPLGGVDTVPDEKSIKQKGAHEHPLRDPDIRKSWGRIQVKRLDAATKRFEKEVKEYFKEQRDRIIGQLQPDQTRYFRKDGLAEEVLPIEIEAKIGKEKFFPLLEELLLEAGVDTMELADPDREFNLTPDMRSWLDKRTDIFTRQINETTLETLKEEFSESVAENESRERLVERIEDTYGNITETRALTIARTEAHGAQQFAADQAYRQAGFQIKIWVWAPGIKGGVRDNHQAMDGEEVHIDTRFSNGLLWPGDPNGPAGEVINCQCSH